MLCNRQIDIDGFMQLALDELSVLRIVTVSNVERLVIPDGVLVAALGKGLDSVIASKCSSLLATPYR